MNKTIRLIQVFILLGVMLAMTPMPASAALARCRVDPIFVLSNGDIVTVTVDIATDPVQVSNIHYILHVPAGVTVREVIHTARGLRIPETTEVYQDSPAGVYTTYTIATTGHQEGTVAVVMYTRLNAVPVKTTYGYNGQLLFAFVGRQTGE
jgi:hypothetical protein